MAWTQWMANAYAEANPALKRIFGTNIARLETHYRTYGAKEKRKIKPDSWEYPYEEIPSAMRAISGREYYRMLDYRPGWNTLISPHPWTMNMKVDLEGLAKMLNNDKKPLLPSERVFIGKIMNQYYENKKSFDILVHELTYLSENWGHGGAGYQVFRYNTAMNVFPNHVQQYETHGDHRKSVGPPWQDFKRSILNNGWFPQHAAWVKGFHPILDNAWKTRSQKEQQWKRELDTRQAAERAAAARQEELKRKAQADAAKASYENTLKFKTEEFNRALAAQKAEAETTRRQLLDDFERQAGNIRTDLTRAHQAELAKRDEEYGRRSKDYEARLAQFSDNFAKQATELSGVRLELAKQKADYENQLAARKLEESKRKQEAEVLQSNLKRRIAIYEAGQGANLHFVGINGKDGQSRGARVFANSGGRYVKSRISYGPNGGFRYLNTGSENSNVPDLFLDVLSPSNRKKERK